MDGDTNQVLKEIERPKRALVLSGGGARGAYEIGVLRALEKYGIQFDLAFGTSVGGINAAFYVQGKLDRLEDLWLRLRPVDVFRLPTITQLQHMINGHRWGLLDTAPLEELLHREMDLLSFKASPTTVGFLTTDLCTLETKMITTDDITSTAELVDVLMASAAIPLLFPARNINGEGFWIDGGLVRNTPIQTAINMGAKEIYIVLVQAETDGICPTNIMQVLARISDILLYASARDGIRRVIEYNKVIETNTSEEAETPILRIKVFQPRSQVPYTLLEFNPSHSQLLIDQGYSEAMKLLSDSSF